MKGPARQKTNGGGLFLMELTLVALVFVADANGYIPLSKTPFLFVIGWISLRLRGLGWRDVGFTLPENRLSLLAVGVVAGLMFWAFEYFVENPLMRSLTGRYPDLTMFREVVGNLQLLAILMMLNLILAAIGEELVWRGYALPRVAGLLGDGKRAWLVAIVVVNVAFGLAHIYQGTSGIVQASVQGALLGLLYLYTRRNLLAPIAAHFVANSCDFVLIYHGTHLGLNP